MAESRVHKNNQNYPLLVLKLTPWKLSLSPTLPSFLVPTPRGSYYIDFLRILVKKSFHILAWPLQSGLCDQRTFSDRLLPLPFETSQQTGNKRGSPSAPFSLSGEGSGGGGSQVSRSWSLKSLRITFNFWSSCLHFPKCWGHRRGPEVLRTELRSSWGARQALYRLSCIPCPPFSCLCL